MFTPDSTASEALAAQIRKNEIFAQEVEVHTTAAAAKLKKMLRSLMVKKFGMSGELEKCFGEVLGELEAVMGAVWKFREDGEEGPGPVLKN